MRASRRGQVLVQHALQRWPPRKRDDQMPGRPLVQRAKRVQLLIGLVGG